MTSGESLSFDATYASEYGVMAKTCIIDLRSALARSARCSAEKAVEVGPRAGEAIPMTAGEAGIDRVVALAADSLDKNLDVLDALAGPTPRF